MNLIRMLNSREEFFSVLDEIEEFYGHPENLDGVEDSGGADYGEEYFKRWMQEFTDWHVGHAESLRNRTGCRSALDAGCGVGNIVRGFLRIGVDAWGLDISRYVVESCDPEIRGRVLWGNLSKAGTLPTRTYDLVVCYDTVEHAPDPEAVVGNLCRLAGKWLHVKAPDIRGLKTEEAKAFDPTHICFPIGTEILCSDGTSKPIERVTTTDMLLGVDGLGSLVKTCVDSVYERIYDESLVELSFGGKNRVLATPNHPFLKCDGTWVAIQNLKSGDYIYVVGVVSEAVDFRGDPVTKRQLAKDESWRTRSETKKRQGQCDIQVARVRTNEKKSDPESLVEGRSGISGSQLVECTETGDSKAVPRKDVGFGLRQSLISRAKKAEVSSILTFVDAIKLDGSRDGIPSGTNRWRGIHLFESVEAARVNSHNCSHDYRKYEQDDDRICEKEDWRTYQRKEAIKNRVAYSLRHRVATIPSSTDSTRIGTLSYNEERTSLFGPSLSTFKTTERIQRSIQQGRGVYALKIARVDKTILGEKQAAQTIVFNLKTNIGNFIANQCVVHNCGRSIGWWVERFELNGFSLIMDERFTWLKWDPEYALAPVGAPDLHGLFKRKVSYR